MTFNHPTAGAVPDGFTTSRQFKSPPIHRTALYRAKAAYAGMFARCGNANGKNPTYADVELRMTLREWVEWSIPHYAKFIAENPHLSPAAARYGDEGHYEIGNIEIISTVENRKRMGAPSALCQDGTKLCSRCRVVKQATCFSKRHRNYDGLNYWCRECNSTQSRAYRKRIRSSAARTADS